MFARMRRMRLKENMRQLVREVRLDLRDFIYPLFVIEGEGIKNEIPSMPDIYQMSLDNILKECENLINLNIYHIILFYEGVHSMDKCTPSLLCSQIITVYTLYSE